MQFTGLSPVKRTRFITLDGDDRHKNRNVVVFKCGDNGSRGFVDADPQISPYWLSEFVPKELTVSFQIIILASTL